MVISGNRSLNVWVVGSSLIKGASNRALTRPDGNNLGLSRHGISIQWIYLSGMKIEDVKYTIEHMKTFNSHPDYLILQSGISE